MSKRIARALRNVAMAVGIFAASTANAVFITDFGVDTETRHYAIGSGSTVTYTPGFFGGTPGTFAVSGTFDTELSHYWWKYFLDGDPTGSLGTFVSESNWLRFTHAAVVGSSTPISPPGFEFPTYSVEVMGDALRGDNHPCTNPFPPGTSCGGGVLSLASLTGRISLGDIAVSGFQPTGLFGFEGFSYNINAAVVPSAVPLPTTTSLLALGVGLLGWCVRRRKER